MLVLLALAALGASLGLLMAHLGHPAVADALVVTSAACGLLAFATALAGTVRQARRLPPAERR